jgi:phage terminase Nu1 subunit (DNA packaging protein)
MTIDDATTISTSDLCRLLGCSKQHISHLERDGIIVRAGRNEWPLVKTVRAAVEQWKAQRNAASASRARWEAARAQREEQRIAREGHELVPRSEFEDAWKMTIGILTSLLVQVPARCTRDLALRRTIEDEINRARHDACDAYEKQATALETTGKAA